MSTAFEDDVEPMEDARRAGPSEGAGASSSYDALGKRTRELSPEPDEDLDTTDGKHSMWLVKVPRFLLEGWSKVDENDRKLGTVRVYDPDHRGNQRMELLLPPHPEPAIPLPPSHPFLQTNYPRKYDLRLTSEQGSARVRNLYAFKERLEGADEDDDYFDDEADSDAEQNSKGKGRADERRSKGKRVVAMVGTIANEAALKPQVVAPLPGQARAGSSAPSRGVGLTPEYREVLRKRRLEASKPRHSVKVLDEGNVGRANMLSSGVGIYSKAPKQSLIAGAAANNAGRRGAAKGQPEKFARMPRNELLDILFEMFDEYPYWSIKGLRNKVQQPEVYLREVLNTVADLHKRGPYSGNWSLKPMFAEMRKQQNRAKAEESAAGGSGASGSQQTAGSSTSAAGAQRGDAKQEDDDDDDDGEDDDADMDQVV